MAEESANQAAENAEAPVFRMQKMYIKDLSFENPNSPDVFLGKQEPKVEVNLGGVLASRRVAESGLIF